MNGLPPEVTKAEVVSLRPGDRVLLTVPATTTREAVERIRAEGESFFPDNTVVVVVGVDLKIVRPEAAS